MREVKIVPNLSTTYFLIFVLGLVNQKLCGQTLDSFTNTGLTFGFMLNTQRFSESRNSLRIRTDPGFSISLGYDLGKNRNQHNLKLRFAKNFPTHQNEIVAFTNLKPELIYTYKRKVKNLPIQFGGYLDFGALLSFPQLKWEGNNTISYTIWNSTGLAFRYQKDFGAQNQHSFLFTEITLSLISYLVRPSYGLPYPEKFLKDGIFDFQRKGMGRYVLSSGQFYSINKFQKIYWKTGGTLLYGRKKHELSLAYVLDVVHLHASKEIRQIVSGGIVTHKFKF